MREIQQKVNTYIQKNRESMLQLWEELVNTESGTMEVEGVNAVSTILRREMEKSNIHTRLVPMKKVGSILIGEWNLESTKAPILFIGHMDTVFKPGAASENPFRVDENGNAHGPGVLDMKGGLVIALYAIKTLAAVGYHERPIKCIFASDEENLHIHSNAKEIIAAEAAGAAAAFNFETGYEDDGFVVGRKGGGIVEMIVHGVASHSGIAPEKGRSAIREAAYKLIEIESKQDIKSGRLINGGMIQGGLGENTVPDQCRLRFGIRFPSMQIKSDIMKILQESANHQHIPDTSATLNTEMCMDCMETTGGVLALFNQLQLTARECGYGEIHSFQVSGVSDSGITVSAGIPTICGMGVRGNGNHTLNEYAEVESLFQRCALAACAVYRYKGEGEK